MRARALLVQTIFVLVGPVLLAQGAGDGAEYLSWSSQQAESIGRAMYHDGRIGTRWLDGRGLKTERAQNYKLRATWFTPEVIRASARFAQFKERFTNQETQAMVAEAEALDGIVVMIEIDPNEGSGVIPLDWSAFLQPKGASSPSDAVRGTPKPEFRNVRALQGVLRRDYDYERFWMLFPVKREDGTPLVGPGTSEIEVVVRIDGREGMVNWVVPASFRSQQEKAKTRK